MRFPGWWLILGAVVATAGPLEYRPAPVDNPLKGLVPYTDASGRDRFPHSMEFRYFPMSDLVTGPSSYSWQPLDRWLEDLAGRGSGLFVREGPPEEVLVDLARHVPTVAGWNEP